MDFKLILWCFIILSLICLTFTKYLDIALPAKSQEIKIQIHKFWWKWKIIVFVVAKQQRVNWTAKMFLTWWQDAFTSWCNYYKISNLCCFVVLKYGRQLSSWEKILASLTVLRLWHHQSLTDLPNRFVVGCIFMYRNKLSVRCHKRSAKRQKPFEAKFMWTRPCIFKFFRYFC